MSKLEFINGTEAEKESLIKVIREMNKKLEVFTTGAPSSWALKSCKLSIKFCDSTGFSSSTCFFHISIPRQSLDNERLKYFIESVIVGDSSFNTI